MITAVSVMDNRAARCLNCLATHGLPTLPLFSIVLPPPTRSTFMRLKNALRTSRSTHSFPKTHARNPMSKRGPKLRSCQEQPTRHAGHRSPREPGTDVPLSVNALAEFTRLVQVLADRGTLDRADLGAVTDAARFKDLLDAANGTFTNRGETDNKEIAIMCQLQSQLRGLRRELGLTLHPSKVTTRGRFPGRRAVGISGLIRFQDEDPIAAKIKCAIDE